jgi:hypothetical protein
MNVQHNIKRALLFLALVAVVAGAQVKPKGSNVECFIGHNENGHAWLEVTKCSGPSKVKLRSTKTPPPPPPPQTAKK